jgi:preprotein translocase subunit SecY
VHRPRSRPSNGLYSLINLFSGGALLQLSVFALGIMPYITASIIIQLLTVVIPRFEALKQGGPVRHSQADAVHPVPDHRPGDPAVHRSSRWPATRRPAVPGLHLPTSSRTRAIILDHHMVLTMTAGTGVIMWLGELITDRGIGNGMSLLIFTSIAARFPACWARTSWRGGVVVRVHRAHRGVGFLVIARGLRRAGQRRIPVQYAKRMVGRGCTAARRPTSR